MRNWEAGNVSHLLQKVTKWSPAFPAQGPLSGAEGEKLLISRGSMVGAHRLELWTR